MIPPRLVDAAQDTDKAKTRGAPGAVRDKGKGKGKERGTDLAAAAIKKDKGKQKAEPADSEESAEEARISKLLEEMEARQMASLLGLVGLHHVGMGGPVASGSGMQKHSRRQVEEDEIMAVTLEAGLLQDLVS